ncbi:hypothetical protein C8A01DRAFT_38438 [Parachaetomium inaequale]|uniref:Hydrophobin n=1 Tax=Parachaetomium inaequale TaxID=2588326 RepID=A0AAN6PB53_9PEZI|nr:hypothetical protein C8A01DRAFT_38438 [Parachaetomium inaequale]
MQFSNLFTVLALAMTASALPAAETVGKLAPRTDHPVPSCSNNQQPVCCGGLLFDLLGICSVSILGGTCSGSSTCCTTNAAPNTLVNIQLLNCLDIL